jgi:hypothetical protein
VSLHKFRGHSYVDSGFIAIEYKTSAHIVSFINLSFFERAHVHCVAAKISGSRQGKVCE